MGQSKHRRPCPAVNRDITPAECGENRLSRYACPESCPFNPFAVVNYSPLLQAEDALDLAGMKRLALEDSAATDHLFETQRQNAAHGFHAASVWQLFFKRDQNGMTFARRWEAAGFPGLRNDERVFLRGKMAMRVALIEVHRVLDDQQVEIVDLLDPAAGPKIIVDRSTAARAVRFGTVLGWIYPLPHFWRMSGTAISMSGLGPFSPLEMLEACLAHLGGPDGREEQQPWLAENFIRIDASVVATVNARRRQMLAGMDASFGAATYELRASFIACRSALVADPAIDVDEVHADEKEKGFAEAMVFLHAPSSASKLIPGNRVLGRVLLGLNEWRVEALGSGRLDQLRERFEARLGDRVRFVKERRDDVAGKMASQMPAVDLALVPPRLLERADRFELTSSRIAAPPAGVSREAFQAELLTSQRRTWLDESLPALDGQTPRAAASNPSLRGPLIELVKAQVRQVDAMNLRTGRSEDVSGLIRELGLTEIDFPAPPPRAPIPAGELAEDADEDADLWSDDDRDDNEDDDDVDVSSLPRARAPAGPPKSSAASLAARPPLTFDEATKRLRVGIDGFDTAAEAMAEINESGSNLFESAHALAFDMIDERDSAHLAIFLIQVWFALVPRGVRLPPLRIDAMEKTIDADEDRLVASGSASTAALEEMFADSPQPNLLKLVVAAVIESAKKMPKKMRPNPEVVISTALVLKAVIAEIDHALRRH